MHSLSLRSESNQSWMVASDSECSTNLIQCVKFFDHITYTLANDGTLDNKKIEEDEAIAKKLIGIIMMELRSNKT